MENEQYFWEQNKLFLNAWKKMKRFVHKWWTNEIKKKPNVPISTWTCSINVQLHGKISGQYVFCQGNKLSIFLTVSVLEENESRFATAIQQVVDLPILDKSKEYFKWFKMFIIVLAWVFETFISEWDLTFNILLLLYYSIWIFATNSNFLISLFFQPDVVDLIYFKYVNFVWS